MSRLADTRGIGRPSRFVAVVNDGNVARIVPVPDAIAERARAQRWGSIEVLVPTAEHDAWRRRAILDPKSLDPMHELRTDTHRIVRIPADELRERGRRR